MRGDRAVDTVLLLSTKPCATRAEARVCVLAATECIEARAAMGQVALVMRSNGLGAHVRTRGRHHEHLFSLLPVGHLVTYGSHQSDAHKLSGVQRKRLGVSQHYYLGAAAV